MDPSNADFIAYATHFLLATPTNSANLINALPLGQDQVLSHLDRRLRQPSETTAHVEGRPHTFFLKRPSTQLPNKSIREPGFGTGPLNPRSAQAKFGQRDVNDFPAVHREPLRG